MLKGDCNKCIHRAADPADKVCVECGIARKNYEERPMTDYISREAAIEALENKCLFERSFQCPGDCSICEEKAIKAIPAADAAEVRRGRWEIKFKWEPLAWDTDPLDWDRYDEKTHSEEVDYYACSKCGYDGGSWKPSWKYCPNCGAKMDESEDGE